MNKEFLLKIESITKVSQNEMMANHTTFKVGGPAEFFAQPKNVNEITELVKACMSFGVPYYVIGRGSNILVSDEGIGGLIIKIGQEMSSCFYDNEKNLLVAEAGIQLNSLYAVAYENGVTGFECLSGIPGTVGGAIRMNAGAYGGEIKDVLISCTYLENGEIKTETTEDLDLSYRHSIFVEKNAIILSAIFKANKDYSKEEILAKYKELSEKRREKQPINFPSAGSTFKRPEGYFAAKLIEDAGLKGAHIGDAEVSDKHAGFIINNGNASAKDILDLMDLVRKTVFEKFKVVLEPEVLILGGTLKEVINE